MPARMRLLLQATLPAVLGVWLVLVAIDSLLVLSNEVDEIGTGSYDTSAVLTYTLLTLPRRAYQLFVYAAVIGALVGLGQLAVRSELIALQAAGMSRRAIAGTTLLGIGGLLALVVAGAELWGSTGDRRANALAAQAKSTELGVGAWSGFWIRDGDLVWNASQAVLTSDGPSTLWQVRVFGFSGRSLVRLIEAPSATFAASGWRLADARVTELPVGPGSVRVETHPSLHLPSRFDPAIVHANALRPKQLSVRELLDSLAYARDNQLDAQPFEAALWYRLSFPLSVLALVFCALPFAFASVRSGGLGRQVFLGMVLALCFYFLQRTTANLFETYRWPMALAYLLPPVLMTGLGWLLLRRRS